MNAILFQRLPDTHTLRNDVSQLSGHPLALSGPHIKLAITSPLRWHPGSFRVSPLLLSQHHIRMANLSGHTKLPRIPVYNEYFHSSRPRLRVRFTAVRVILKPTHCLDEGLCHSPRPGERRSQAKLNKTVADIGGAINMCQALC